MKEKDLLTLGFKETPKKHFYYHQQGDMIIIAEVMGQSFALLTSVAKRKELSSYLDRIVIHNPVVKRTYHQDSELVIITKKNVSVEAFKELLDNLYEVLKGCKCECRHCHQEKRVNVVYMDRSIELLCDDCSQLLKTNPSVKELRVGLGLMGSLIFGLIPALIWGFFNQIGMIISLTGILFGLTGYLGFRIFAGGMNRKGFWLSMLMTYIDLWIGEIIALTFSIQSAYTASVEQHVTLLESFRVLPAFLSDSEVLGVILAYHFYALILIITVYVIAHLIYKRRHSRPLETL
ncbi:MAG: hypothetical protein J6P61_02270 [Erysipelotrichaceae bacterium]|nr:hypothetical protein [Erysipelotrichaceae bacterium]